MLSKSFYHITLVVGALFWLSNGAVYAQSVRVIDNKGSLKEVINNRVTESSTVPVNPQEGDVWFDTITQTKKIWNATLTAWQEIDDQTATEVPITDTAANFTATNVEDALTELATTTHATIYNANATLASDRRVTMSTFDLDFEGVAYLDQSTSGLGIGVYANDLSESIVQQAGDQTGNGAVEAGWVYAQAIEAVDEKGGASTGIVFGNDGYFNGGAGEITFFTDGASQLKIGPQGAANGTIRLEQYGLGNMSGTAANILAVESDGDVVEVDPLRFAPQHTMAEIYLGTTTTTNLATTFADITLDANGIVDAGYTEDDTGITVMADGRYRITFRATATIANNTRSGAEFQLTLDGTAVSGTLAVTYHRNSDADANSITIVKVLDMGAGETIRAQGRRYTNNGNIRLLANGTSLLIEKVR